MDNRNETSSIPAWLSKVCQLVALLVAATASGAVSDDKTHPVLGRFPSRTELQQRVDKARAENPDGYAAARDDFALAVRSRFSLVGPPHPEARMPRVKREVSLWVILSRAVREDQIRELEGMAGGAPLAQFQRAHLEELVIDDTPELPAALLDVLLNGWDDWSQWNTEKLEEVRAKFPELHRVYAIRELVRLKYNDINGVLLERYAEGELAPYLSTEIHMALLDLDAQFDTLEFFVQVGFSANDVRVRERLQRAIPGSAQRASKDPRCKAFWEQYLESPISLLRFEARKAHGLPVPDTLQQRYIQQEWVAENDPDPKRREEIARTIETRERLHKLKGH